MTAATPIHVTSKNMTNVERDELPPKTFLPSMPKGGSNEYHWPILYRVDKTFPEHDDAIGSVCCSVAVRRVRSVNDVAVEDAADPLIQIQFRRISFLHQVKIVGVLIDELVNERARHEYPSTSEHQTLLQDFLIALVETEKAYQNVTKKWLGHLTDVANNYDASGKAYLASILQGVLRLIERKVPDSFQVERMKRLRKSTPKVDHSDDEEDENNDGTPAPPSTTPSVPSGSRKRARMSPDAEMLSAQDVLNSMSRAFHDVQILKKELEEKKALIEKLKRRCERTAAVLKQSVDTASTALLIVTAAEPTT